MIAETQAVNTVDVLVQAFLLNACNPKENPAFAIKLAHTMAMAARRMLFQAGVEIPVLEGVA